MTRMHRKLTEEYGDFFIHVKAWQGISGVIPNLTVLEGLLERAMCGSYTDPGYQVEVLNPNHKICRRCIRYT